LEHGNATERPFARGKPHDRALRIGVDQRRVPPAQMPMHREAACQRTLATATFHGGNRDDRAHHSTPSRPSRDEVIRRIKTLSDSRRIVPRCGYLVVSSFARAAHETLFSIVVRPASIRLLLEPEATDCRLRVGGRATLVTRTYP